MLDNPRIRRLAIGKIHYRNALVIFLIQRLRFESQTSVFQRAEPIIEIGVDRTGICLLYTSRCV